MLEEKQQSPKLSNGNTREDLIARLPIPGPGRRKETEEQKMIRKTQKEFIKEYKERLAEALPKISPVLIKKAVQGDIQAIKEVNDRVMGKAPQTLKGDSENPLVVIPIYGGRSIKSVQGHNSSEQDIQPDKED